MATVRGSRIFRELARLHVRAQRKEITCSRVSETHCTLLTELGRADAVPMSALVARLQLDKGWVSRAVDQLVQDGLAARRSMDGDRRSIAVSLTVAGRKRFKALELTLNRQIDRVFARLTPRDQGTVSRALALLHEAYVADEAEVASTDGRSAARALTASA